MFVSVSWKSFTAEIAEIAETFNRQDAKNAKEELDRITGFAGCTKKQSAVRIQRTARRGVMHYAPTLPQQRQHLLL